MTLHLQEWGQGDPLIALHPLALESTAFAGVARLLARRGLRTLGVDLPGFGQTPADDEPPTPERLARPVIELARSLETPPLLLGMSMGGRVALEAALLAPRAFRGVVAVAPYLPWREHRWAMRLARHMNPEWAAYLPLERAWPLLKGATAAIEAIPRLENDWLARACVRVVYYSSCSVTRVSLLSASRELALEPAFGARGLWTRLARLELPAAFLWAGKDRLIPGEHAAHVTELLPDAAWLEVSCSGHFVNSAHYRCMEHAMSLAVERVIDEESRRARSAPMPRDRAARSLAPCLAGTKPARIESAAPAYDGPGG